MAADRVMKSVTSWFERKLFLKVSAAKTKVVRPMKSEFLGFGFWKGKKGWKCKPLNDRKKRLYKKCKEILVRKRAAARPLSVTFNKLNQVIDYFAHRKALYRTLESTISLHGKHQRAARKALPISCS